MKRMFMAVWALILSAAVLPAQQMPFYDEIAADHNRCGVSSHSYEPSDTLVTPAPGGYKAFYVSHVGRHGSRFSTDAGSYKILEKFKSYIDGGLVSEKGVKLYEELEALHQASEGNYGKLTELGAMEHRQIAGRLARHYPEIFSDKGRNRVNATSTTSGRVKESRKNFLSVLEDRFPSLDIKTMEGSHDDKDAYERVAGVRVPSEVKSEQDKAKKSDEYKKAYSGVHKGMKLGVDRIAGEIFTTVPEELKGHRSFYSSLISTGNMGRCAGFGMPVYESVFTTDDFYYSWSSGNAGWFFNYGVCSENPTLSAVRYVGCVMMKHWIEEADAAIRPDSKVAADLRFSHDVKVLPFLAVVAPETFCFEGSISEINDHCFFSKLVCMGCNVQFIFYRNGDKPVLVKVLQNEKEVKIPGAKAFKDCYYKWSDLKDYYENRIRTLRGV